MWPTLLLSFLLFGGFQFVHAEKFDANSTVKENTFFNVASSSMQGIRTTMEDAHSHILPLTAEEPNSAYFGVFDGHGNQSVALLASEQLHEFILKEPEYKTNVSEALKKGFMAFDHSIKTTKELDKAGATANVVIIKGDYLYCANAGDTRAVASVDGSAQPLSIDHKPKEETEEVARVRAASGIAFNGRIYGDSGNIAVSRALGDFEFKQNAGLPAEKQIIIAQPDVQFLQILDNLEFVISACDGVWDVMSNQAAIDFVRERMANNVEPEKICEEILKHCLKIGSEDNMTVLLVSFLRRETYAKLCETVSRKYKLSISEFSEET